MATEEEIIDRSKYYYPEEPVRFNMRDANELLIFCYEHNASDITFQTGSEVYAEIYGRLYHVTKRKLSNTEVGEILNGIYGPNGTAQILTGLDVDTYHEIRPSRTKRYRFRVNGTGCTVEGHDGIQVTLRSIPNEPPPLSVLKLPQDILEHYAPDQGIVYVTGPTGSGKTTLLASMIRAIGEEENSDRKILTYESPIEFVYDNVEMKSALVSQSEIPRHLPTFAHGVRNALRRKPRLILVGEARDPETITAALEAALTGHPVYTTLHTVGVAETMRRLVNTFPTEERRGRTIDIIETIRLAIWQKLSPTLDGKRVALREYLAFTYDVRDKLLDVDPDRITQATRRMVYEHGQPMIVEAKARFEEGIISQREYDLIARFTKREEEDMGLT